MFVSVLLDKPAYYNYAAQVCSNIASAIKSIGSYFIVLFGVLLVIVAVMHIVKGLAAHGKEAWLMTFGTLLFGGFLTISGLVTVMSNFGKIGKDTIGQIAGGMTPTTATPITAAADPSQATFGVDAAKNAVGIMSDSFFLPFAQAVALSIGVVLLIMAIVQIGTYFRTSGKGKISIGKVAAMAVIGSILFAATPADSGAGWDWIVNKAVGATRDTVVGAANGNLNRTSAAALVVTGITVYL